ncbi:MAG: restriction endonuclease subunit S [Candidatus Pacebacteria bacterium]|jgi:type I restriction enzyme S subunit|nr:restriction endonuclease subunit S [Candidatus Paceibacterota bacterium]
MTWPTKKLGDVCDFERGTEPGSKSYNRENEGVPFIRVGNIAAQIQEQIYTTSRNIKLCDENDILLTLDGSPGIVARGFKGAHSSGIRKVIVKKPDELLKDFVYFVLQTDFVQEIIEKYTTGMTIKHASKSLEHIQIPLPSLPEQKKIVYVLDSIQEVIRVQEKIIEKTKELKKTLLNEIFNSKIKNQKWIKLGDEKYFEIKLGGTPRTNKADYWSGKIYWITPNDLNKLSSPYITRTERKITEKGLKTGSTLLSAKSIILSTRAPIGYLAILNEDMAFNQGCKGIIIKKPDEIFNLYLFYYLTTQVNKLKDWGSGSTFRELSTSGLKQFSIPLIDIKKQREIAEILQTIDQKIEIEQKKKALYEELFKAMLNKLMNGEIKVDNLKL